ncbi:MAG: hypothetical protein AAFR04_09175 [Pseudomonadota bacterium]
MRHALGVLGVLAAGVLLFVSAAMNWQFGFQLGRSEFDGQIYGAASAAADCLKALVPFFFFAALRNKMWSQAAASAVVWLVVVGFSLTSALGHAALNRQDTTGQRANLAATYKDLRGELTRAEEQLAWVPQHRPAAAVQSAIDSLKTERAWRWSRACTVVKGRSTRGLCQRYHGLTAELAAAQSAAKWNTRIGELKQKLAAQKGTVHASADPQATVIAGLLGLSISDVQTILMVLIALLLEIGSGLGMYVAFSQWRVADATAIRPAARAADPIRVTPTSTPASPPVLLADAKATEVANDNRTQPQPARLVAPETDVERFNRERVDVEVGSSLTATELYEEYCGWCEEQAKEPLALPTFGRNFRELGVKKDKLNGKVHYIGIKLRPQAKTKEDRKQAVTNARAA